MNHPVWTCITLIGVLMSSESTNQYWKAKTIDGFITDSMQCLQRSMHSMTWVLHEQHKYSITDSKTLRNISISLAHYPILLSIEVSQSRVRVNVKSGTPRNAPIIFARHGQTPDFQHQSSYNFEMSLNYQSGRAFIKKFDPTPPLSSRQTMLLIDYILPRMGMKTSTMFNVVQQSYVHQHISKWITSIEVRCIYGETTDWLSQFGYFNENRDAIALEMRRLHHLQVEYGPSYSKANVSLGPMLLAVWTQSGSVQFYDIYRQFSPLFKKLVALRGGHWTREFAQYLPPAILQTQTFQISTIPTVPNVAITTHARRILPATNQTLQQKLTQLVDFRNRQIPNVERKGFPPRKKKNNPLDAISRPESARSVVGPW